MLTAKGWALAPLIEDMRTYGREWLGVDCDPNDAVDEFDRDGEPAAAAA